MKKNILMLFIFTFFLAPNPVWALTQTEVSQLYVTMFGRSSEGAGNTYWQTDLSSESLTATAAKMLNTEAAVTYFGPTLNDNKAFIEHIYINTLGKTYAEDPDGVDYWVNELFSGRSKSEVVADLIVAAQDPVNAGAAQDQFNNKVDVSDYCAEHIIMFTDQETFNGFIRDIDFNQSSVTDAKKLIDKHYEYYEASEVIWFGDYTIHTEADIPTISGYTILYGNLTIGRRVSIVDPPATTIESLAGLESLKTVSGTLTLIANSRLTTLDGLNNLSSVGSIDINGNGPLENIEALSKITLVQDRLSLRNNGSLKSLKGLENISSLGSLYLSGNHSLESLDYLSGLTWVAGDIDLRINMNLTNLHGLYNLVSVGGNIGITSNEAMYNLSGLENLTMVGGNIDIENNDVLTSLDGMDNLKTITGTFLVKNCPLLNNLEALNNLTTVGGVIVFDVSKIVGFSALSSVANITIRNVEDVIGFNNVTFIKSLTLDRVGWIDGFNQLDSVDNLILYQVDSLDFASQLTSLEYLVLHNITNLEELSGITSIGHLSCGNMQGFQGLTASIGELSLSDGVTSLKGLEHITELSKIYMSGCNSLSSFEGLNNLNTIKESIVLVGENLLIKNFKGLDNLIYLPRLFSAGSSLTSLEGLEKITSLGSLYLQWTNALISLDGLQNLTSIKGLAISDNSSLQTLVLPNLISVGEVDEVGNAVGSFRISDNPELCNGLALDLQEQVQNGLGLNADVYIYDNKTCL